MSHTLNVHVTGEWTKGVQTRVHVRSFEPFIIDEPRALGGHDEGANPVEHILAGLTGCVSVMIAIIAKEQSFTYTNASFDASGTLDVRGLMGTADVTPNFQTVTLHVTLETEETDERLRALEEAVESRCPVMTMLRDSGVRIDGAWTRA